MAALTFTKIADHRYQATAQVSGDFALHLERTNQSDLELGVSSVEDGAYQVKKVLGHEGVFDQDFTALVYPKYIRVVCTSLPISGKCYVVENASE